MEDIERQEVPEYVTPEIEDYGTLTDLTELGGTVAHSDVPHGHPHSAYPSS